MPATAQSSENSSSAKEDVGFKNAAWTIKAITVKVVKSVWYQEIKKKTLNPHTDLRPYKPRRTDKRSQDC